MTSFLTEFRGFTVAIMLSFIFNFSGNAFTVSELQAVKYNGQVFLTWKNPAGTNFQYNVYRSSTPITVVSNLSTANFLGYVRDNSAKNVRKSNLYGSSYYFKITATGAPLATDRGLYVTTCTSSGSFYYAVMVVNLSTGQEDKLVLNGLNSLLLPISESVANPQPVLQYQSVETDGTLRYEYAQWGNNQSSSQYPAFTNAGSYAWNFTVFKSGNSANKSIYMLFKDESPFTTTGLDVCTDCNIIKIDDRLPNGVDTYWSGWNDNYNMYSTNNSVPSSGVVKMYTQARLKETLEWVRKNIGADSNKVYLTGVSHNGFGALLTSQMWPSMVTAVSAKSAPIILKALNSSEREQQWCSSSDNFETDYKDPNTGQNIPIWKLFDIRHMYLVNEMRGGPFISGINGKQDVTVGWVQKYFWYDSVDASRQGGTWYWDQRNHTNDGATFTEEEYTPAFERFTLARSYPAFSFCSVDQNPGNGTPTNGDQLGALNGYLDWNDASIIDNSTSYSITCFVKNMYAGGALLPQQYDSCTTDIAFRRIQKFKPTTGKTIYWNVKNSANKIVQQGSLVYTGDPITLYGIKVYRTNSTISLSYTQSCSTIYYVDADNDGYGSSTDPGTTYCTPPSGVVTNNTDCNDANAAIKPGAQEICDANDVDEDCDGLKDDADGSVTGKITYYVDADHDNYGSSIAAGIAYCNPPAWYITNHTDCNDANASIKPGGQELCDANDVDEDCDGLADDLDISATGKVIYYVDADHDNFGSSTATGIAYCNPPAWFITNHTDCNDANSAIKPGGQELCDANDADEDCDGLSDDADASVTGKLTYYIDSDHDSYGSSTATGVAYCNPPAWYTTNHTDCNDSKSSVKPNGTEICDVNDVDEDCDGLADDADNSATGKLTYYIDVDHDTYGSSSATGIAYCNPPAWVTTNHTDCNDTDVSVNQSAIDICDGIDNNCNGIIDENAIIFSIGSTDPLNGCKNDMITLTATGTNMETFKWYKGTNTNPISGQTNSSYSLNYESNTVKAVVTNGFGCTATSNVISLGVLANPTSVITVNNGGNLDLCMGSVNLSTNAVINYARQWYRNDLIVAGATNPDYLPSTDGNYTVMVTNNLGCSKLSAPVTVTDALLYYSDTDQDGYGSAADPGTYSCIPLIGKATNNTDCNDGIATIYPGAADICDGLDNNCNGSIDENAITVSVGPPGPITLCKNDSVTFLATGSNIESFSWYKGSSNAIVPGQTNSTYTLMPYQNTSVKAVVSNSYGCSATSNTVSITSVSNPTSYISSINLNLCLGAVLLTASGESAAVTWQWYKGGTIIPGATSSIYSASQADYFEVIVTNTNSGCSKLSPAVTVINACKTTVQTDEIKVYPNPSNGLFHLLISNIHDAKLVLKLSDITGRVLFTTAQQIEEENFQTDIDLKNHPAGIYMLEIILGDEVMHQQIINQ